MTVYRIGHRSYRFARRENEFLYHDMTPVESFLVNLDEKGQSRINNLRRALARHVLDYAIPRLKILEVKKEFAETASSAKLTSAKDSIKTIH